MGLELLGAATFFMIPRVESIARKFLRGHMSSVDTLSQKSGVAGMLTSALEFPEVQGGKDDILGPLVSSIGLDWAEDKLCLNLSRSAAEYILSRFRDVTDEEEDYGTTVDEYFMFRNVVLWHVYHATQDDDYKAREGALKVLPGSTSLATCHVALMIAVDIDKYVADIFRPVDSDVHDNDTSILSYLDRSRVCKASLEKMLLHINFSRIPAPLLLKIIQPLRIVPAHLLLKAFLHQVPQRCMHQSMVKTRWKHHSSITISNEGHISWHRQDDNATAIAIVPRFKISMICRWTVHLLQHAVEGCFDFGFVHYPPGHVFEEDILGRDLGSIPSAQFLRDFVQNGEVLIKSTAYIYRELAQRWM